jgi:hypothetical protein
MQLQQPYGAAQVSEHHQFFAEDFDPMGQVLQFVRKADRLPKAAQIFAAWRVGADMGQFCIFDRQLAMEITSISRRQVGALVIMEVLLSRESGQPTADHLEDPAQRFETEQQATGHLIGSKRPDHMLIHGQDVAQAAIQWSLLIDCAAACRLVDELHHIHANADDVRIGCGE